MPARYLVYEDSFQSCPFTCNDLKTVSIIVKYLEKEGKNPQIYQRVYANRKMEKGVKDLAD